MSQGNGGGGSQCVPCKSNKRGIVESGSHVGINVPGCSGIHWSNAGLFQLQIRISFTFLRAKELHMSLLITRTRSF